MFFHVTDGLRGRYCLWLFIVVGFFAVTSEPVHGQATSFGGNAQHTSSYPAPAQTLNTIKWTTNIDFNPTTIAHYGAPLVTAANTVLVPVKTANNGFRVDAFNGANGALKHVTATDYILPLHNWVPTYNPCITTGAFGTRMYYAGAGGTIWHIDNPDSNTPGPPVREVFYTTPAAYAANAAAFNASIFVNTPLTADASGNVYFGFRVQGTAPAPLNTVQSGFARLDVNGNGTFVLAGNAANDSPTSTSQVSHNLAPALSNDGNTLYVVVRGTSNTYLLGLNPSTLATKHSVILRDPRNGNRATVSDNGTASPMIGPDGDVYFGVLGNPSNGSRGFLLHFNADLSVIKTPGAFGWDYTPGIVPVSAVPSYTGPSSYLIFCKYNDYPFADGTGVNRVALLDPNDTEIEPHASSAGLIVMREVLTVLAPTPDPDVNPATFPNAVKEWCINAPAVNPATGSVFFTSEDGHSYRWNLLTNTLDQTIVLTPGILEPYVPTVIGPDGTVYTLNGGTLFALGINPASTVVIRSSSPDLRNTVVGNSITFTATVGGSSPTPTGTVTFTDFTYVGLTSVSTTLASNVPLNASGQASVTTSALEAGNGFLGNHFITATYNGDATHPPSSITMLQKVHANASTSVVVSSAAPSNFGQPVSFTATVSAVPAGAGTPTGMVTFSDGPTVIGQVPLNASGTASITRSNLAPGLHAIVATYVSDTRFAASAGNVAQIVQNGTSTTLISSSNPSNFGQPITFTATVSATNGAPGTPTGSVIFKNGGSVLANVHLDGTGRAVFSTSSLSIGTHTITAEFTGTNGWLNSNGGAIAQLVQDAPLLLTEENSQRAVALDLVTRIRDPFTRNSLQNLSPDQRRRVSLFVWRLGLSGNDTAASVTVLAEDSEGRVYNMTAEFVGPLSAVPDVTQVVFRLPDVVGAPRDLFVRVILHGRASNRGLIGIAGG